jgi:HAD superfamily hydrolase (TIGR01509 family)
MTSHPFLDWTPGAVVFDCDGTLMDTERHWVAARDTVLSGYGIAPDPRFAAASKGVHYTECGRLMAKLARRPDLADEMTTQLLAAFRKLVADNPMPTPGAHLMVRHAARFAPLAVASNCPQDVVESCLASAGMLDHFARIVVPGRDVLPKPAPDVYLTAVRAFDVEPSDALAVEDSLVGLRSAARAGLRVIGVGSRPAEEMTTLAHLWVTTLADPELLSWAASRAPRQQAA